MKDPTVYAPRFDEVLVLANQLRRQADALVLTVEIRRWRYLAAASVYLAAAVCARDKGWRVYEDEALLAAWQATERAQGRVSKTERAHG